MAINKFEIKTDSRRIPEKMRGNFLLCAIAMIAAFGQGNSYCHAQECKVFEIFVRKSGKADAVDSDLNAAKETCTRGLTLQRRK